MSPVVQRSKTIAQKLLLAIPLVLMGASLALGAETNINKELITSNGKTRVYYLYVPKPIKGSVQVPLLVTLHGSGHNGLSLVEKWTDIADKEGFIVAGPDSQDPAVWNIPGDGPDFIHELVEYLKTKYPINPRKVYLFGHSGGACFALQIALMESNYFAAMAIHAGALREDQYRIIDYAERKIPMGIWVGTVDPYFPLDAVHGTRDQLKAHGVPVELTEIPKHNHWYYDMAPKINREAWDFMKKSELTADPQYKEYQFRAKGERG
ncbi:MAG TPA: alpha/beta hydrolase-fold protein [Blastocatellia bacterium]